MTAIVNEKEQDIDMEGAEVPFIIRSTEEGVPNGRGGYTDVTEDIAAYWGRKRMRTNRTNPVQQTTQGPVIVAKEMVIFNATGMGLDGTHQIIEAVESTPGDATPKPGGYTVEIENVREYPRTTQVDVKEIKD